jgi:hypothetical protein
VSGQGLKATIFALLAINTAIFLTSGSPSEALDSVAWLVLLVLFELEAGGIVRPCGTRARSLIRALRLGAAAALIAAMAGYVQAEEWPDVVNVALWCAVIGLLEVEVRRPIAFARHRAAFAATASVLYLGLAAVAGLWLWRGDWFAAYDAALWLAAFAMLEMDVLGIMRRETRA